MTIGPLPQAEFTAIYARVPRLTVELVLIRDGAALLTRRSTGPCAGLWHLPGGTVRYGEPLVEAVARVGADELGATVIPRDLLGVIEYPSHLAAGIDWPVGIAFACDAGGHPMTESDSMRWFGTLPEEIHEEQRSFLAGRLGSEDGPRGEEGPLRASSPLVP